MASSRLAQNIARKSLALGPSVRNILLQHKLDPSQIASTGPHQTLLKSDVLSFISRKKSESHHSNPSNNKISEQKSSLDSVSTVSYQPSNKSRYPRRRLSPLEIEVINGGGVF